MDSKWLIRYFIISINLLIAVSQFNNCIQRGKNPLKYILILKPLLILKGLKHDSTSNFHCYFSFLMSKIVNMSTFNVSSKFEREISSNKRYREFEILWFVNKAPVLFLFTCVLYWLKFQSNVLLIVDNIFYKQIELVFLFDNKPYSQTNGKCLHHWKEFEEQDSRFVYI